MLSRGDNKLDIHGRIPSHVGIIMDGNGRWAESRGLPRIEGHRRGSERVKEIVEVSLDIGIKCITLYAFSTENWQRPKSEVSMLMKLLELYLKNELSKLVKKGIVFRTIGETWRLPENIQKLIKDTTEMTASNKGMTLVAALSYSSRNEITRGIKKIIASGIKPEEVTEDLVTSSLDTDGLPQPDLIIRTSGERRLSNFLLWQSAYAELYFTDVLWPDFDKEEFMLALQDFQGRERRFGSLPVSSNAS
ncbi:MAG: di-trans,poly-cis-decaprenylcistransferase [Nitrospirae bacterium GWC2_42_7]|nr:MAG: di-trans,poly-cis-decaprenylcistransferase [Nitrospirae bacterium GWC2_42_7]